MEWLYILSACLWIGVVYWFVQAADNHSGRKRDWRLLVYLALAFLSASGIGLIPTPATAPRWFHYACMMLGMCISMSVVRMWWRRKRDRLIVNEVGKFRNWLSRLEHIQARKEDDKER